VTFAIYGSSVHWGIIKLGMYHIKYSYMRSSITVLNPDKTEFDFSNVTVSSHYNIVLHCVYNPFGDFDNEFSFLLDPKYDSNTLIILWHPVEQGDFDPVWVSKLDAIAKAAKYKLVYLTGCSHNLNINETIPYTFDLRFFPVFDVRSKNQWDCHSPKQSVNVYKTKKFMFINSKDTAHRRYILSNLLDSLGDGVVTYRCQEGFSNTALDFNKDRGFSEDFLTHAQSMFDGCLPHLPIKFDDENSASGLSRSLFLDSYLNIVGETHFVNAPHDFNRSFVTEKTFNAIANNQMFIVVGHAHSLDLLHSLGYKTFDTVIDETYDTILDNELRLKAVTAEILRFISRPIEDIYNDYRKIVDIIEHNRDLLYRASIEQRLQELVDTI
jgi:hypothetical protein